MTVRIIVGDCRAALAALPARSVHCVVTSPPYLGLRSYGTEPLIWGGDLECPHSLDAYQPDGETYEGKRRWQHSGVSRDETPDAWVNPKRRWQHNDNWSGFSYEDAYEGWQAVKEKDAEASTSATCTRCGAWRGHLGLEPTIELYVAHIVEVMRAVKRVLRDDGTVFCNLGDSYWGGKGQSGQGSPEYQAARQDSTLNTPAAHVGGPGRIRPTDGKHPVLKPLDLMGVPWRVALALQADGWWLRSDIVWAKTNPMPESVQGCRWERCRVKVRSRGKGKSEREVALGVQDRNGGQSMDPAQWADCPGCRKCEPNGGLVLRKGNWRPTSAHEYIFMLAKSANYYGDGESVREALSPLTLADKRNDTGRHTQGEAEGSKYGSEEAPDFPSWYRGKVFVNSQAGRNLRDVWTMNTEPFPGAHFATYPTELVERCIKAGTSERGICAACGSPWVRVIDRGITLNRTAINGMGNGELNNDGRFGDAQSTTIGWRPSCRCNAGNPVPATVLDPFAGAGTTGLVADRLGRNAVLIELKAEYAEMAAARIRADAPMFAQVEVK